MELYRPVVVQHQGHLTWPLIFKVKFWKCCISGMGRPIDMEKGMCVDRMLDPYSDFWTMTSPMTLTLDFQGQILKMLYLKNGRADWHGTKGMWVNRMLDSHCDFQLWPHPWPWPLIFKVKFWKAVSQEWEGRLTWTKGMWVDRMLDPHCDFELWPHLWLWPLIFKVKFWKCCNSRMGGPIDMERKGCESIGC